MVVILHGPIGQNVLKVVEAVTKYGFELAPSPHQRTEETTAQNSEKWTRNRNVGQTLVQVTKGPSQKRLPNT